MHTPSIIFATTISIFFVGCGSNRSADTAKDHAETHTVTIRDIDGTDLLTDSDIVAYDTKQHVLTLRPGIRDRIKPSQPLVGGAPFSVVVDGTPVYSGKFTTSLSSQSLDDVVIDLFPQNQDDNQLQISLGYPSRDCFTSADDPRENARLISVLRSLNKTM